MCVCVGVLANFSVLRKRAETNWNILFCPNWSWIYHHKKRKKISNSQDPWEELYLESTAVWENEAGKVQICQEYLDFTTMYLEHPVQRLCNLQRQTVILSTHHTWGKMMLDRIGLITQVTGSQAKTIHDMKYPSERHPTWLNQSNQWKKIYLSTQHMSSRCCGTCAGLRRAGQSERRQARKALVLLERSSLARPNHSRCRFGHVHSRKQRAGTSSGVRADFAFPLLHSFTITGGTAGKSSVMIDSLV